MFILTQDHRIINTDYLATIYKTKRVLEMGASIIAGSPDRDIPVKIADFDNYDDCEIAFDSLVETLKAQKELFSFGR